jgi:hypothetical protein
MFPRLLPAEDVVDGFAAELRARGHLSRAMRVGREGALDLLRDGKLIRTRHQPIDILIVVFHVFFRVSVIKSHHFCAGAGACWWGQIITERAGICVTYWFHLSFGKFSWVEILGRIVMVLSRFVKMLLAQSVVTFPGVFSRFLAFSRVAQHDN